MKKNTDRRRILISNLRFEIPNLGFRISAFGLRFACAMVLVVLAGCGMQAGVLLSVMGAGKLHMIDAEFKLGDGPVLVLVDDLSEKLTWPEARDLITEEVGKKLLEHKATKQIISPETVSRARRTTAEFDNRGAREIGRMAEADQVLWLEVQSFFADEEVRDTTQAAVLSVTVKVIDPKTEERGMVRVWPSSREGKPVAVQLSPSDVIRLKTLPNIGKELCEKTAKEVVKLFYKHSFQDPED